MDLISILCLVLIYLSAAWCGLIKQSEHIERYFLFSRPSALERVVAFASSGGGQERYTHLRMNFSSILRVYYTTFLRLCQAFLHGF